MPSQHERSEHEAPESLTPPAPPTSNAALASRFNQMFPVLSAGEIDRVRRFDEVRRFPAGDFVFQAGEAVPGMYVILSGRVVIVPRDVLGRPAPVAAFAELIGAPVEEMAEGTDVGSTERVPLPLETGVEGIFAVGDVRCGSVKRVGAAIGEGAAVVAQLHTFFGQRASAPALAHSLA